LILPFLSRPASHRWRGDTFFSSGDNLRAAVLGYDDSLVSHVSELLIGTDGRDVKWWGLFLYKQRAAARWPRRKAPNSTGDRVPANC
jgi:hypothetical protein